MKSITLNIEIASSELPLIIVALERYLPEVPDNTTDEFQAKQSLEATLTYLRDMKRIVEQDE